MDVSDRYKSIADLPQVIPLFPLNGALLLPRGQLPLNIFEPRYLDMVEDAMAGHRIIGMVQLDDPDADAVHEQDPALAAVGCCGRITSYAEAPDDRLLITLTGICRFQISQEQAFPVAYRCAQVNYAPFAGDLVPGAGQDDVDRAGLLQTFKAFLDANSMDADWNEISAASNETLVNALSMLSPYPPREKQALLEAFDLKSRADVLVALTEMNLARQSDDDTPVLQ